MPTTLEDRRIGCILGAALADAAAQPVHWNYDASKLNAIWKNHSTMEFIDPSQNPYYRLPTGRQSCYGDQAYVVLKSLVECQGVETDKMAASFYDFFGPNSEYENDENNRYLPKSGVQKTYPIEGPWRQASLKSFLSNYAAARIPPGDEQDKQMDGVTKVAPVVAMYAGRPEMLQKVEEVARLTQNNDTAVGFCLAAARILEKIVLTGCEPLQAVEQVLADLSQPDRPNSHPMDDELLDILQNVLDFRGKAHFDVTTRIFKND